MPNILNIILSSLILLAPLKGFSEVDKNLWNRYFDGDPAHLGADWSGGSRNWGLSGKPFEYKTWIRGYSRCAHEVDNLLQNLSNYEQSYSKKSFSEAENYFSQIGKA